MHAVFNVLLFSLESNLILCYTIDTIINLCFVKGKVLLSECSLNETNSPSMVWIVLPALVGTIREQSADQQLLTISGSHVKRRVSIDINTVDLATCIRRWRHDTYMMKRTLWIMGVPPAFTVPFWIKIWDPVNRPYMAAICKGLFPSLFCS